MAYLHNRAVNLLNLHYVIGSIATNGGGAFYGVWLLKVGIAVPHVLLALAAIFGLRFFLRSFLLPVAIRTGMRTLVIAGAFLMGASYLSLSRVHDLGFNLASLVLITALADAVYWPSYHAFFATLGDEEHRGQQIGVRESVTALLGVASPLLAGWLLIALGPRPAFYATGAVWALAAAPIFFAPDIRIAHKAHGAFRSAFSGAALFIGDGLLSAGYFVVWQLALFLALRRNVMVYGAALALAALAGAVGGLFLGRLIDRGKGMRAVLLSGGVLVCVIVLRAGIDRYPALAIIANALGAFVTCLYTPTLMTAMYNKAKRSPCAMRFHITAEAGWDIGIVAGLCAAALLVVHGLPLATTILVSLTGTGVVMVLLGQYYERQPVAQTAI